jgi:hypothetical protein
MQPELLQPFDSAPRLLVRSARVFFGRLPFLVSVTLAVFIPGKLVAQLVCAALDVPPEGVASYLLMDFSSLILGSLTIPAAIYGLTTGRPVMECLRRGRKLWGRMFWNKFKVEMTVALWSLLLFIPGIVAMVKLSLTDAVVTLDENETDPLEQSRELTAGIRWRVFFVIAPMMLIDLGGNVLVLTTVPGVAHSRWLLGMADSLLALIEMWSTVAGLMMYLGRIGNPPQTKRA